ncbi:MAG: hypothetical protein GDA50_07705 [Alphaproteobacteria bacterium GM202ARS2]|nr:hypothetical protein [Alphaproteobacteria bacterium GM202ARS2]
MNPGEFDQFWTNSVDSIRHALEHFFELSNQQRHSEEIHHQKWIVISAALAAESFFKAVLLQANEEISNGDTYHSLPRTIQALKPLRLPKSESLITKVAKKVSDQRDEILHRPYDSEIELSHSAILLFGLLKVIERRVDDRPTGIVAECQLLSQEMLAQIKHTSLAEYKRVINQFVAEDYSDQPVEPCPECGANSVLVLAGECVACFADLGHVTCEQCGEGRFYSLDAGDPGCETCFQQSAAI